MRTPSEDVFDAVASSAVLPELVPIARSLFHGLATRSIARGDQSAFVLSECESRGLSRESAWTPFGNAIDLLSRGPENPSEAKLARALAAQVLLRAEDPAGEAQQWLRVSTETPFDVSEYVERALGARSQEFWTAWGEAVLKAYPLAPGEALVGASALARAGVSRVLEHVATVSNDPRVQWFRDNASRKSPSDALRGELAPAPRGPFLTTLMGCTGILLALSAWRFFARHALRLHKKADVVVEGDAVRVTVQTEMLGRRLSDKNFLLPRSGLVRVAREVRYPRLGMYAGLLGLALGSYLGMSFFVEGIRAASPSLLLLGVIVLGLGVGAELLSQVLVPGLQGKCRLVFVPKRGKLVAIGNVEAALADAFLGRLRAG